MLNELERVVSDLSRKIDELRAENSRLEQENRELRNPKVTKKATVANLRRALLRAVKAHGHDWNCSAARGMEHDCHCGWVEVKKLAGLR